MMHVVSVLVENKPGVLLRVAGVLAARGINIEKLTACPAVEPGIALIHIAFDIGDEKVADQVILRIDRLVQVIRTEKLSQAAGHRMKEEPGTESCRLEDLCMSGKFSTASELSR